jgi:hypothetical protein
VVNFQAVPPMAFKNRTSLWRINLSLVLHFDCETKISQKVIAWSGVWKYLSSDMLFKKLAKIGAEQLAKQPPTTLEKARAQAQRIEERISNRKQPDKDISGTGKTGDVITCETTTDHTRKSEE